MRSGKWLKPILPMEHLGAQDSPKAVVDKILATLDEASILSRIKGELREKLAGKEPVRERRSLQSFQRIPTQYFHHFLVMSLSQLRLLRAVRE